MHRHQPNIGVRWAYASIWDQKPSDNSIFARPIVRLLMAINSPENLADGWASKKNIVVYLRCVGPDALFFLAIRETATNGIPKTARLDKDLTPKNIVVYLRCVHPENQQINQQRAFGDQNEMWIRGRKRNT